MSHDIPLLRFVRTCSLMQVMCQLWERCARCVPSVAYPSRRTLRTRLLHTLLSGARTALDRHGRLRSATRLKRAFVGASYTGWEERHPVPADMACSTEGQTALMLMVCDRAFSLWDPARRRRSREAPMRRFDALVRGARVCFSGGGALCEPEALDLVLMRFARLLPSRGIPASQHRI